MNGEIFVIEYRLKGWEIWNIWEQRIFDTYSAAEAYGIKNVVAYEWRIRKYVATLDIGRLDEGVI